MVPDYYAILGVDPQSNPPAIEAALAKCQPMWASGTRNPKRKHEFQSYLDLIPEMRKTLLADPNTRAAYDAERLAGLRQERDHKLDELQILVRLRAAKGGLSQADRTRLEEKAKSLGLDVDDVSRMTHGLSEMAEEVVVEEMEPDDPLPAILEPTIRRQIRVALEHLKRDNLYQVLDLHFDAPPAEILRRAEEERTRWMQKAQVTAEKTAWLEAVSYAQTHLTTDENRARYDWTLIVEVEEGFRDLIAFVVDGLPRLDDATKSALIEEAMARGIVPDRAERLIRRVVRERGLGVGLPAAIDAPARPIRWLRCRQCQALTSFGDAARNPEGAACGRCGASLRWDCPICAQTRWVDQDRCQCGFPAALREPVARHFDAAQALFKGRRYAEALGHLQRIQELAPRHGASRKAIDKVKERLIEVDRMQTAFEAARTKRHLVAARAALDNWGKLVDPFDHDWKTAKDDLFRQLREAQGLAAQGRSILGSDPAGARNLLRKALQIAADLPEARQGLKNCPPDPPADLKARLDGRRVVLHWSSPKPDGLGPVLYRIVRKRNGVPSHPNDGVAIAEGGETEAHDSNPPPGEMVGYAVFSQREDLASPTGPGVGPILILADVVNVQIDAKSGQVDLVWDVPEGASDVRVVRKVDTPPTGPEDGERISTEPGRLNDRNLKDDIRYHYGLYALYRMADGKARASRGVVVAATPNRPVRGVEHLAMTQEPGGGLRFQWDVPERGQVRIFRAARSIPIRPHTSTTAGELDALGGHWLDSETAGSARDLAPPSMGLCHYVPFTASNGRLVAGKGIAFSNLPDPSDLRAVRAGGNGRVFLRWRWTPHAGRSLVVLKQGTEPYGPDDPGAQVFPVQEVEYGRTGSYVLNLPTTEGQGPWHVAVHSVATIEGEQVISPGLDPSSRTVVPGPNPETTLTYAIRRPLLPGRPWTLTVQTEPPGQLVLPTALIGHPRTVPLTVDDGEILQRFPEAKDGDSFTLKTGPSDLARQHLRLFPDPHALPEGRVFVRVRHPEVESVRI